MKHILIAGLELLRDSVREYLNTGVESDEFDPECGICDNVRAHCLAVDEDADEYGDNAAAGLFYDNKREWFRQWPKYSGDHTFPVPPPKGFEPDDSPAYSEAESAFNQLDESMWDGEYGELRMELLEFLIEKANELPE